MISSPWAKLVRPVVPKIIDRPSAAIASSSEKTIPPTNSWSAWTPRPVSTAALPIGKVTKTSASSLGVTLSATCLGLRSAAPLGNEALSIFTVKVLPRLSIEAPGSAMSNTPVLSLAPLPTTLPVSSSRLILMPGTAAGGFVRRSLRQPWMWMVSSFLWAGWRRSEPDPRRRRPSRGGGLRHRGCGRRSPAGHHDCRDRDAEQHHDRGGEASRAGVHGTPEASSSAPVTRDYSDSSPWSHTQTFAHRFLRCP